VILSAHHHGLLSGAWRDLAFGPFRDGVDIHRLYTTEGGPSAALLRYAPGASVPLHEHTGFEHVLLLDGAQEDQNGVLQAGGMAINPPGSRHSVTSRTGCLALLIWEKPVRFV
jgi:anti-sigma factor ChrR (cupin superfamily)